MEYEMEGMRNTIDDRTRELEELESTCRVALRKGQEMEYEMEGLRNTIEDKTQQIADLESTCREAMRKGQEMEYELENFRDAMKDKTQEIGDLESTCREAMRKGQEMEYEIQRLHSTIEERTQEVSDLESTCREAMWKGQEMEYEIENLRVQLTNREALIESIQDEMDGDKISQADEIASLRLELEALRATSPPPSELEELLKVREAQLEALKSNGNDTIFEHELQRLFSLLDSDANGSVSLEEFKQIYPSAADYFFSKLDINNDGVLDMTEMRQMFLNPDGSGDVAKISLFLENLQARFKEQARTSLSESGGSLFDSKITTLFQLLDADGSGDVSLEEF